LLSGEVCEGFETQETISPFLSSDDVVIAATLVFCSVEAVFVLTEGTADLALLALQALDVYTGDQ
jgi:hypothetical protein